MFVTLSCLTLWDPVDRSPPGSSVHGILQARILEWVAMPSFRGSSQPRNPTRVSRFTGRFFTIWAPGKPPVDQRYSPVLGRPSFIISPQITLVWLMSHLASLSRWTNLHSESANLSACQSQLSPIHMTHCVHALQFKLFIITKSLLSEANTWWYLCLAVEDTAWHNGCLFKSQLCQLILCNLGQLLNPLQPQAPYLSNQQWCYLLCRIVVQIRLNNASKALSLGTVLSRERVTVQAASFDPITLISWNAHLFTRPK